MAWGDDVESAAAVSDGDADECDVGLVAVAAGQGQF